VKPGVVLNTMLNKEMSVVLRLRNPAVGLSVMDFLSYNLENTMQ
jgi:hypothetical protein